MVSLNQLKPAPGAKKSKKRLGRGIGSGLGKTSGKGHKGQWARSGGGVGAGFEGGQTALHRRLPKSGFTSCKKLFSVQVRLSALNKIASEVITLEILKKAGIINKHIKWAKIFLAGEITKPVQVIGIPVSSGAKAAIEAAGGKVEE